MSMIAFTVFDASSRKVTHHRWSASQNVLPMLFAGEVAVLGQHIPFNELVPIDVDFVIANPDAVERWTPPLDPNFIEKEME